MDLGVRNTAYQLLVVQSGVLGVRLGGVLGSSLVWGVLVFSGGREPICTSYSSNSSDLVIFFSVRISGFSGFCFGFQVSEL